MSSDPKDDSDDSLELQAIDLNDQEELAPIPEDFAVEDDDSLSSIEEMEPEEMEPIELKEELFPEEKILLEDEVLSESSVEEELPPIEELEELSIEEEDAIEKEDSDAEKEAEVPESEIEIPGEESSDAVKIPSGLQQEIVTVLTYMDKLLESLPDDKIEEFARSEYFDTYKKLFKDLGIT